MLTEEELAGTVQAFVLCANHVGPDGRIWLERPPD